MKRVSGAMMLLATAGGCLSDPGGAVGPGSYMSHAFGPGAGAAHCGSCNPGPVAGLVGPYGQPMTGAAPSAAASRGPATGDALAQQMIAQSLPPDLATQVLSKNTMQNGGGPNILLASASYPSAGGPGMTPPSGVMPAGGQVMPPGMPALGAPGMGMPGAGMPGMGTPGPGMPGAAGGAMGPMAGAAPAPFVAQRTSIRFAAPSGMKVSWYTPGPAGAGFSPQALNVPGRYNFPQAAIYRLKLSDIPDRPGLELYPTLEVVPANGKTCTFLAHSSVPVSFTPEDLDQVQSGNFVVKVIYLPDPQFQDLAAVGPDEVVSSRLEPGVDPIAEAMRRGCILAVVRLGNIDLEAPNTPAMDAPSPYQQLPPHGAAGRPPVPGMMPPGARPGMLPAMPGAPGGMPTLPPPLPGSGQPAGKATATDGSADASKSRAGWSLFDSAGKPGR